MQTYKESNKELITAYFGFAQLDTGVKYKELLAASKYQVSTNFYEQTTYFNLSNK